MSRRTSARPAAVSSQHTSSAPVRISEGAELLAKLRVLHDAQPRQFKQLMNAFADEARAAADSSSSDKRALTTLAARFAEAAREGNVTPLVPSIDSGAQARARYLPETDALVRPSEGARELFRSLLGKVTALAQAADPNALQRRAR